MATSWAARYRDGAPPVAALARRIAESDDFEVMPAEPELSVVCFRHLPEGLESLRFYFPDEGEPEARERLAAVRKARGKGE